MLYRRAYHSPLGVMAMVSNGKALTALSFQGQKYAVAAINNGEGGAGDTTFQETVWEILREIPYGKVVSYGEIARQIAEKRNIGRMSAQAVGGAVGRNPVAIIVPCHRVIGSDGSLTGYAGGLDKKEALLKIENWKPAQ